MYKRIQVNVFLALAILLSSTPSIVNANNKIDKNAKVVYHVIQKGDTLWNITNKYKMKTL